MINATVDMRRESGHAVKVSVRLRDAVIDDISRPLRLPVLRGSLDHRTACSAGSRAEVREEGP